MKNRVTNFFVMLSLAGAQLFAIPASRAAALEDAPVVGRDAQVRTGTFAGARIRLAIGSQRKEPKLRAGFTFASMQSGRSARGASFTRFGEGLEFGITDRSVEPHMSIAGYSLTPKRLGAAEGAEGAGKNRGLSTPAIIGIAVGGAAVLALVAFVAICSNDSGECGSD